MRNKRFVLSLLLILALALALVPQALAQGPFSVTILHTNDTHAHLEPFTPFKGVEQGGVSRRFTLIKQIRAEGGNVLLLDAGDVFQGTLYFNQYLGQADLWFMNKMGYDAMAVGNHEFDKGQEPLAKFIDGATFPLLSANLDCSGSALLKDRIKPYVIKEIGGEKVGIFGLTTEDVKIISNVGEGVEVEDPVEAAKRVVAELEGQGINKIIALTHIGYNEDQKLATAVAGIDIIIGGHSHTLLGDMEGAAGPYPTVVTSPAGDPVLIVHDYQWGSYLGRLDVTFDAEGKVTEYSGGLIFVDASIASDPEFDAKLAEFAAPIEELKNTIIGQTAVDLDGEKAHVRTMETNLGNLICDAMLWKTATDNTQIAIQNGGGIRASAPAGDISMGKVLEILPFGNTIVDVDLTGAQIIEALENGVSRIEDVKGRFPQVAGLRYTFDPNKPAGSRIVKVEVWDAAKGAYVPIDLEATYRVATNNFLFGGGDGYEVFKEGTNVYETGVLLSDTLAEYIAAHSPVKPKVEGRIVNLAVELPITGGEKEEFPYGLVLIVGGAVVVVSLSLRRRLRKAA